MKEKDGPASGQGANPVDPSLWRGLTQPRLSRRQVLASAGTGAGALGLSAFLAACGVRGNAPAASGGATPAGGVGTAAWWAKQQLHHTVNFANCRSTSTCSTASTPASSTSPRPPASRSTTPSRSTTTCPSTPRSGQFAK